MNLPIAKLLEHALAMKRCNRRCAACLVVKARGSTPQSAGALMLVDEDFNTFGTIGGGCVEAEIRRRAHAMLCEGVSFVGGVVSFKLDHDYGWDDGLICGGTIELAITPLPAAAHLQHALDSIARREPATVAFEAMSADGNAVSFVLDLPPRDRLYIAGAGHVGQALARLAVPLEYETTIFDDRADLLERFAPPGCAKAAGDIANLLRAAPIDNRTYVVVVTRGHRHDEQALHAVVGRGARYVGMIGSRRKIKLIFDDLKAMGVDPRSLADVRAPIGVDIGSVTVEEIALSIAAELVQVRRSDGTPAISATQQRVVSVAAADNSR